MKFFCVVAALALAVTDAANCDLVKVVPLISTVNFTQCAKDLGFSLPIPPTAAVVPKVCANQACLAAITTLKDLGLGDCSIVEIKLGTDIIAPIEKACNLPSPVTPVPSTPAPVFPTPATSIPSDTMAPGQ